MTGNARAAVSHLSDNVVLLNYILEKDSIKRAMSVIKSRASYHEPDVRQFLIGPAGIVLADGPEVPGGPSGRDGRRRAEWPGPAAQPPVS